MRKVGDLLDESKTARIRPYADADWQDFIALETETSLESLRPSTPEELASFTARWPEVVREKLASTREGLRAAGSALYVLETSDGRFAGHLWLTERTDLFSEKRKLYVLSVAVSAEYRGRGWGRMLMQHAIQHARDRGYDTIELGVVAANLNALSLYNSMGFGITRHTMELALEGPSARTAGERRQRSFVGPED